MGRNVTAVTTVLVLAALTGCGTNASAPGPIPNGTYRYFVDWTDSMPELATDGRVPEQYQSTHDFIIKGNDCTYEPQNLVIKPVKAPCFVDTEASTITVDLRSMPGGRDEDVVAYKVSDDTLTLILNEEQRMRYQFPGDSEPYTDSEDSTALEVPFVRVEE